MGIHDDENSTTHMGLGALAQFEKIIARFAPLRVLLVVDLRAYQSCGARAVMEAALQGCEVLQFSDFDLNPKIDDVVRGLEACREFAAELVVSFGGGTAIDLGKLISVLATQPGLAQEIIVGDAAIAHTGLPLIAIPTTAGTGSEATHFAVVYVDGKKYSLAHAALLPAYAIIDPAMTFSLPAGITAATGLDAFCQAIESLWAVGANEKSTSLALRAASLAWNYLEKAVNHPDPESRIAMCEASHLAGQAINISKTTAPHALSYSITSRYGTPHGMAVAMTLSPLLAYNSQVAEDDCQDARGVEYVRRQINIILKLLDACDVADACQKIEVFITSLGCQPSLGAAGIRSELQLQHILAEVNAERLSNNPRRYDPAKVLDALTGSVGTDDREFATPR